MMVMYFVWILWLRPPPSAGRSGAGLPRRWDWWFNDAVDLHSVDLSADEYVDIQGSEEEEEDRKSGRAGYLTTLYRWVA